MAALERVVKGLNDIIMHVLGSVDASNDCFNLFQLSDLRSSDNLINKAPPKRDPGYLPSPTGVITPSKPQAMVMSPTKPHFGPPKAERKSNSRYEGHEII